MKPPFGLVCYGRTSPEHERDALGRLLALVQPRRACRCIVRDRPALKEDQAAAGLTTYVDTVAQEFPKLILKAGLNGNRGFYALRHTFQTVAEECGDFPAVGSIMGHHDGSMAGLYRERIGDDRLRKVVDYMHGWLFDDNDTK